VEHLVRFTSAEGRDGYHTAAGLDDALKFVERLRNNEEVDRVRLFRLQEVPIEFKAYYKVELRGADAPVPLVEEAPAEAEAIEALPAPAPPGEDDDAGLVVAPSGAADPGARRLFGRG
jgi:hypothetical protein